MRLGLYGFIAVLAAVVTRGIFECLRKPKTAKEGEVQLHILLLILGAVGSIAFLIPAIIVVYTTEDLWTFVIFLLFSSLCGTMVIAWLNCRITYDEKGFLAGCFFGYKRKFSYEQVTAIQVNKHESYHYLGQQRVMIDEFSVGGTEFIKLVKKKYRTTHDGNSLPKIEKTKYDIFNGNVEDPGGFLICFVLMAILVIGFLIGAVYFAYFTPSTESNTMKHTIKMETCEVFEDQIVLVSEDARIYRIRSLQEQRIHELAKAISKAGTPLTVYSTEVKPDDAEDYCLVKAIICAEEFLLSFEETNAAHAKEMSVLVYIAAGFCLMWGAIVALTIAIGRNPKKYSQTVIRLFFKDGYIKY